MLCYQAEEVIQGYLDDLLSEQEAARLARHVLACACCRRTLDEMQRLHQAALAQPMLAPGADLTQQVMAQIQLRPQRVEKPRNRASVIALTLLVLVLGYGGVVGWTRFVWTRLPIAGLGEWLLQIRLPLWAWLSEWFLTSSS